MTTVPWAEIKALLLSSGGVRVEGAPVDRFMARSAAGPGAGGTGSFFFSTGTRRVRLSNRPDSPATLRHYGDGEASITIGDMTVGGCLEEIALHCPRQAYITVSGSCTYRCRFCPVPSLQGRRRSPDEIVHMVAGVRDRIDAISLTSGVTRDPAEEESYVLEVADRLAPFDLPVGVSIYPAAGTARRLHDHGVAEVKFNVETATATLFDRMCPGFDRQDVLSALRESVDLFGEGRVYSNVLIGLGETDREMAGCIGDLTAMGVIPVLRPLTPAGELGDWSRPTATRLLRLLSIHRDALGEAGLDGGKAETMCASCTGCDLSPWRDV